MSVNQPNPAIEKFPIEIFPAPLQRIIQEAAESYPCPPEFVGVPLIVVVGTAIGNSRALEVKKNWHESARIYSAIVAPSGAKKSPAFSLAIGPLRKRQDYLQGQRDLPKQEIVVDLDNLGATLTASPGNQAFTTDTTWEALCDVILANPRGVAVMQDELGAWVKQMNQYKDGGGADRQGWLGMWAGADVVVNRKRDPQFVRLPLPFVNVFGCLPPDVLADLSDEDGLEDGFIQRIAFSFPENVPLHWNDKYVSDEAIEGYQQLCDKLWQLEPAKDKSGRAVPKVLKWTDQGRAAWVDWVGTHYRELNDGRLSGRLRGTWAKMEGYCARFALIIHLCRYVAGEVNTESIDEVSVERAIRLANYFKSHARKVFDRLEFSAQDKEIDEAMRWIRANGGSATEREIYTNKVCGKRINEEARALLERLRDREYGEIKVERPDRGGPESRKFYLTPKFMEEDMKRAS